ncbi:uncharacterized protein LOC128395299 isoform X2 [Panonychus citri]|nr:uncharacterized protein LOC128395299 isoform X2 [Panonychus citri]XP_053211687.1 uncharacterized protein LOC128395299 isoform X2 [Panonychus citri]
MNNLIAIGLITFLTLSTGWSSTIIGDNDFVDLCRLFNQLIVSGVKPEDAVNQVAKQFISSLLSSSDQSSSTTINFEGKLRSLSDPFTGQFVFQNETVNAADFLFGSLNHLFNYLLTINSGGEIIDSVDSDVVIIGKRSAINRNLNCDNLPTQGISFKVDSLNQSMADTYLKQLEDNLILL